jgi:hypothetical protein
LRCVCGCRSDAALALSDCAAIHWVQTGARIGIAESGVRGSGSVFASTWFVLCRCLFFRFVKHFSFIVLEKNGGKLNCDTLVMRRLFLRFCKGLLWLDQRKNFRHLQLRPDTVWISEDGKKLYCFVGEHLLKRRYDMVNVEVSIEKENEKEKEKEKRREEKEKL